MITEDYVSFETAKLLKEKGFDGVTEKYYLKYKGEYILVSRGTAEHPDSSIDVPTLQMAMKWLREVHNIHINIDIHYLHFSNQNGWMYIITKILENGTDYIDSEGDENDKYFYSTYEQATEAAIKYTLENLI